VFFISTLIPSPFYYSSCVALDGGNRIKFDDVLSSTDFKAILENHAASSLQPKKPNSVVSTYHFDSFDAVKTFFSAAGGTDTTSWEGLKGNLWTQGGGFRILACNLLVSSTRRVLSSPADNRSDVPDTPLPFSGIHQGKARKIQSIDLEVSRLTATYSTNCLSLHPLLPQERL